MLTTQQLPLQLPSLSSSAPQVMYVYSYPYQTGGLLWISFVNNVMTALIIAQITAIGLFGIKEAYLQAAWAVPLPIATIYFILLIRAKFTTTFR